MNDEHETGVCRHCGSTVSDGYETEYGVFCDEYHADIWETHNASIFTRVQRALGWF